MTAYYNEIDPAAAQWLRNLIEAGHIAPGYVDERSIEDVYPSDLRGFTQCHFFAGVGVWSYALRQAGFNDDRSVWTGSCPCQPFSAAGKGAGFADERHLWPAFNHLIQECKPDIVLGEQVASKDGLAWIDLVLSDLEAQGYAAGAVDTCSAGFGAPHIRQRLYWVGHAGNSRLDKRIGLTRVLGGTIGASQGKATERAGVHIGRMAHTQQHDSGRQAKPANHGQPQADRPADWTGGCGGAFGGLAHHNGDGCQPGREGSAAMGYGQATGADCGAGGLADTIMQQRPDGQPGLSDVDDALGRIEGAAAIAGLCHDLRPGPTNGFWRDADWLGCRDGKFRPVEPGTQPLVDGAPARVVRLRAYGNAINAQAAQAFIECVMEAA